MAECKVFVGNLSWSTNDQSLHQAFSAFGEIVDHKVILERDTGRSRGFAFVTFADEGAMNNAIGQMDGADLDGRPIRVNKSEGKGGGKGKDGGKGKGKGGGKGYGKGSYGGGFGGEGGYNQGGGYGGGGGGGW